MTADAVSDHDYHDILAFNQEGLKTLQRAIALQSGGFSLILARCNYQRLQSILLNHLEAALPRLQILTLPERIPSLLECIQIHLKLNPPGAAPPSALMITGLATVRQLDAILKSANLARDTYRSRFLFPVVLWIDDDVLARLSQLAQDLKNLGPPTVRFALPAADLIIGLHREANDLFARQLRPYYDPLPSRPEPLVDLSGDPHISDELTFALRDLETYQHPLDDTLEASLAFVKGRDAHRNLEMEVAKRYYEDSLAYWQAQVKSGNPLEGLMDGDTAEETPSPLHKKAVLLFHLGLWWRSQGTLQRSLYATSLRQARQHFEAVLAIFRDTHQPELTARFLHPLAEVLQKQKDWVALDVIAREGLVLHAQFGDYVRLARDHGFLAEVALAWENWLTAQAEAQRSLDLLRQAEHSLKAHPQQPELLASLEIAYQFQRGWYRFLLGEAQMHLDQPEAAIALLEQARQETDPAIDLTLFLQILEDLHGHYFDQGDYRQAFDVKLEQRQVEYRYNLRAFIGASYVRSHEGYQAVPPPAIAAEIAASGRQQDVENLLARLQEPRYQLIVIHGPSGVGKSSILNAGLVPALRPITPEGRRTLPVLVQSYGNWQTAIATTLQRELPWGGDGGMGGRGNAGRWRDGEGEEDREVGESNFLPPSPPSSPPTPHPLPLAPYLPTLKTATEKTHFVVFVFDQFEEFFFDEKMTPSERRRFYQFIETCIRQPWIKVVIALREDYLHYLLEMEQQIDVSGIDGGVLSNDVRYPLGNFSRQNAEAVIRRLTESANFVLEETLIRRLVHDLAMETGDVRPIELQVVGAQLQRQGIATLSQYKKLGDHPKETLVLRFLNHAIKDCGPPNERLARLVLYLLTDEDLENHLYRPLKTFEDLDYELDILGIPTTTDQLRLVLDVLVGSGLVFQVPEEPDDRFQLVHDYLVKYVRDEESPELLQKLKEANAGRRQAEKDKQLANEKAAQLLLERNQLLEQRLKLARRTIVEVSVLALIAVIVVGWVVSQRRHSTPDDRQTRWEVIGNGF